MVPVFIRGLVLTRDAALVSYETVQARGSLLGYVPDLPFSAVASESGWHCLTAFLFVAVLANLQQTFRTSGR